MTRICYECDRVDHHSHRKQPVGYVGKPAVREQSESAVKKQGHWCDTCQGSHAGKCAKTFDQNIIDEAEKLAWDWFTPSDGSPKFKVRIADGKYIQQYKELILSALKKQKQQIRRDVTDLRILGKGIDHGIHNSALHEVLDLPSLNTNDDE